MNHISASLESRRIRSLRNEAAALAVQEGVLVREAYDRWAPTYDEFPNPLLSLEERQLGALIPKLRGKRVLDLACGTGRWLEKLSPQGAEVGVGVDFSVAMLRVAGTKPGVRGRLAGADCKHLPFQASTFDFVVCSFALAHIRDLRGLARELGRVARTGADILTSDLHPEAYEKGWRTGFRDARGAVEIDTWARSAEETDDCFCSEGFECLTHISLWLGEPERPVFDRAGKSNLFSAATKVPAILVSHFRFASFDRVSRSSQ